MSEISKIMSEKIHRKFDQIYRLKALLVKAESVGQWMVIVSFIDGGRTITYYLPSGIQHTIGRTDNFAQNHCGIDCTPYTRADNGTCPFSRFILFVEDEVVTVSSNSVNCVFRGEFPGQLGPDIECELQRDVAYLLVEGLRLFIPAVGDGEGCMTVHFKRVEPLSPSEIAEIHAM